jgi:LysM repeat protein
MAAPPQTNDLSHRVYILEQKIDEHGQRLEVVDRRTKDLASLRSTHGPSTEKNEEKSKHAETPITPIGERYEIKSGDSLWSIARRFKVSVNQLKQRNNLSGSEIQCGKVLFIPASSEVPGMPQILQREATTAGTKAPEPIKTIRNAAGAKPADRYHSVEKGDTLNGIARQYSTTIEQLQDINGISNADSIQIGQRLQIPATREDPLVPRHSPDSYRPSTAPLQFTRAGAFANRTIRRPYEARSTGRQAITSSRKGSAKSAPSLISYTIKPHETLESVAELFATSVIQLRTINQFDGKEEPLQGSTILVPTAGIFLDLHS